MTEKDILLKCIDAYTQAVNNYNNFDWLENNGLDTGICSYIIDYLEEKTPSWMPYSPNFWYDIPNRFEDDSFNLYCLQKRLDKLSDILAKTYFPESDDSYIPVHNPNQLKLFNDE